MGKLLSAEEVERLTPKGQTTWVQIDSGSLRSVLDEVRRSRALLKRIEWSAYRAEGGRLCPACNVDEGQPHRPTCELAALIGGEPPDTARTVVIIEQPLPDCPTCGQPPRFISAAVTADAAILKLECPDRHSWTAPAQAQPITG